MAKKLQPNKRTYLDPIHQDIMLDGAKPAEQLIIDLIDTPEFQRLRRIHQLGVSYFTFQGAEGSRFTHSVGVMHIASKLVNLLGEQTPSILKLKPLILATALLHDVGHGPYSHVTEQILGYNHEEWSCKIISGKTVINEVLRKFDKTLPEKIVSILQKSFSPAYLSQIVSSQLDCDRFDYLLRDSYMTGTAYGLFALHRILISLEIDEVNDCMVVSGEKGQTAVEDYIFARYSMYAQVYYHKKNLASRSLLKKLLERACLVADKICFMDEPTRKLLKRDPLNVSEYQQLDDIQMTYHIKRWLSDADPVLSDLSSRFINRKLFKAIRLPPVNTEALNTIQKQAKKIVSKLGLDPDYYIDIESTGIRPYEYYHPDAAHPQANIMVRTDSGEIKELSTLSPAIKALVKGNFETHWLIFPHEADEEIRKLLSTK